MTEDARFQLREVRGDQRYCLASSPDAEGIGLALLTLFCEGQIDQGAQLGIYDADAGKWLLNPYARSAA